MRVLETAVSQITTKTARKAHKIQWLLKEEHYRTNVGLMRAKWALTSGPDSRGPPWRMVNSSVHQHSLQRVCFSFSSLRFSIIYLKGYAKKDLLLLILCQLQDPNIDVDWPLCMIPEYWQKGQ